MMSENNGSVTGISVTEVVPRDALVKKMKNISRSKNIFIYAPGGYGKSIAAAQWLSSVRGKTTKMVLGDADNNPEIFYKRLSSIFLKIVKKPHTSAAGSSLAELLEIIGRLPEKGLRNYLLFDDVHMITDEEIINSIPIILTRLPDYICCCLAGRSQPTQTFMETGLYEIITQEDFLFSAEEIQWLGEAKDHTLTNVQIEDLLEVTGGWAMYLSALLSDSGFNEMQKNALPQTLMQYLDARVWSLWDDETKALLLKLAVPVELMPELCERLTGNRDGRGVLEMLAKKENAFLSLTSKDTWRFQDVFREFLLEHKLDVLTEKELQRVNDITAEWYYEQGDYFTGVRYYCQNGDYEGIMRCEQATINYSAETEGILLEAHCNATSQFVLSMPIEFIEKDPLLIIHCSYTSYLIGNSDKFLLYKDILNKKLAEMAEKYPDFVGTYFFMNGLDYRTSLKNICEEIVEALAQMPPPDAEKPDNVATNSITQNLPYFHRSMRDYSEFNELAERDLVLLDATFGVMIGNDWQSMKSSLIAGIYYERGELMNALNHALAAYNSCESGMHPETVFVSHTILSAILYAMGANHDADEIMKKSEQYVKDNARFLHANLKALQTERYIRAGDIDAAKEWLTAFASRVNRPPFYQMCRHFTTLRAYIAAGEYKAAIEFGERLMKLTVEYNRPLDQIESNILLSVALLNAKKDGAKKQLKQAVNIAQPYNFTQLFINEGKEILDLLWEIRKDEVKTSSLKLFTGRLIDDICKKHNLKPNMEDSPELSKQQLVMLKYLSKGMTYNEIAKTTNLGRGTVKSHILLMYKRLGVQGAQEAVIKAKMLGLLE